MEIPTLIISLIHQSESFIHWFRQRRYLYILFGFISLLLPGYVLFLSVISPAFHSHEIGLFSDSLLIPSDTFTGRSPVSQETAGKIREIESLELEQAFLKNRLTLAKTDSIYMTINLYDSILSLEIQGVTVRRCPIQEFWVSRRLVITSYDNLLEWASTPFHLTNDLSTIPKIRYFVKKAPKDTMEAALQGDHPIPPDTSSIYFTLFFDKNLVVEIEQTELPDKEEEVLINQYVKIKRDSTRYQTWKAVLHRHTPDYGISLQLKISESDARAVYRGLPVNSRMALRLPE